MQAAPLSSSQKTEILRRQAFKCNQCQTDLEPVGRTPPHFAPTGQPVARGASAITNIVALCPDCHAKSTPSRPKNADENRRLQRDSGPAQKGKRFVRSGFDNKKF